MATQDGSRASDGRFVRPQAPAAPAGGAGDDQPRGAGDGADGDGAEGDGPDDEEGEADEDADDVEVAPLEPSMFTPAELRLALDTSQPEARLPVVSTECLLGLGQVVAVLALITGVLGCAASLGEGPDTLGIFGAIVAASLLALWVLGSAECAYLVDLPHQAVDYERRWLGMVKRYTVARFDQVKRLRVSHTTSGGHKGRPVRHSWDVNLEAADGGDYEVASLPEEASAHRLAVALANLLKSSAVREVEEE